VYDDVDDAGMGSGTGTTEDCERYAPDERLLGSRLAVLLSRPWLLA
jgi:hypothetical protein